MSNELATIDSRPLMMVQRPRLTPAQRDLYVLVCDVCKGNNRLTKDDAFEVYKKYAAGEGWFWVYDHDNPGHEKQVRKKWPDYLWQYNFQNWLFRALGALVVKGYLTVIPAIDFSNCPGCEATQTIETPAQIS